MSITEFDFEGFTEQIPRGIVNSAGGEIQFLVPSLPTALRFEGLFAKEPDTISWISNFASGETFVDIGANVGMYSIWAAKHCGVKVVAFEPESQNVAIFNQNIFINNLGEQVTVYPVAISNETKFSLLHLNDMRAGSAFASFDEAVGHDLKSKTPVFQQGAVSVTMDELISNGVTAMPNHMKIDVDGFEHKVISGAHSVLANVRLRSVMIELNANLAEHMDLIDVFDAFGFDLEPQFAEGFHNRGGGNCLFQRSV